MGIVFRQAVHAEELVGQQAAAERRVGHVGDAQLAGRLQGFFGLLAIEQ